MASSKSFASHIEVCPVIWNGAEGPQLWAGLLCHQRSLSLQAIASYLLLDQTAKYNVVILLFLSFPVVDIFYQLPSRRDEMELFDSSPPHPRTFHTVLPTTFSPFLGVGIPNSCLLALAYLIIFLSLLSISRRFPQHYYTALLLRPSNLSFPRACYCSVTVHVS